MNVGKMITAARKDDRRREFADLYRSCRTMADRNSLLAYWWWGWDIHGNSGLGKPGAEL